MTARSPRCHKLAECSKAAQRRSHAQSIVETVVGLLFLVPIVLFLLDMAVIVLANMANDNLAKTCCRAAASATDTSVTPNVGTYNAANTAATQAASGFASSAIINPQGASFLTALSYNPSGTATGTWPGPGFAASPGGAPTTPTQGQVGAITTMVVTLPVPFPAVPPTFTFNASDFEPIVSIQPGQ